MRWRRNRTRRRSSGSGRLRRDLADKTEQLASLTARWEQEKSGLNRVGELKKEVDELRMQAERAQREGDLATASELLYGRIPALERELSQAISAEREVDEHEGPMVSEEVGPDDIATVIAAWTGIPAGRLLEGETEKLLRMESELASAWSASGRPSRAVSDAVRRARAGISDPDRPTGSFLFIGPTGVGKTELAKALADFLFDDPRAMVRIDMSEYSREAFGGPACRRAARLRRVRGGRSADRGGPPPALLGDPARRGREGPPRRLRHPAAGARRRPAHRRPGPHGRLPQHAADPDLEPGQPGADGPSHVRGATA